MPSMIEAYRYKSLVYEKDKKSYVGTPIFVPSLHLLIDKEGIASITRERYFSAKAMNAANKAFIEGKPDAEIIQIRDQVDRKEREDIKVSAETVHKIKRLVERAKKCVNIEPQLILNQIAKEIHRSNLFDEMTFDRDDSFDVLPFHPTFI